MADDKLIYYDKNTGLYVADEKTIKDNLKRVVTEAYGQVFLDDNYPDGIVINGFTSMIDETLQTVQTIYNMLDINNAEGVILDTLGNIRNEHRKEATNSYLYTNITIDYSGTITFVANTLKIRDENNNEWSLLEDVTIDTSVSTTASGIFISNVKGVLSQPNTLQVIAVENSINIAPENITITATQFISGQDTETDLAFRNRMNDYPVFNSITLKENLNSELMKLSFIEDIKVYYNNSTLGMVTKGGRFAYDPDFLLPGQMLILVKPSENTNFVSDTDLRQRVFDIINDYKSLGSLCWLPPSAVARTDIGVVDIEDPVDSVPLAVGFRSTREDSLGQIEADCIAQFAVPVTQAVSGITLTYVPLSNFNDNFTDPSDPSSLTFSELDIKNLITLYVKSKGIGENLTAGGLSLNLASSTKDIIQIVNISITGSVGGVLTNNDKILTISNSDITLIEEDDE